MAVVFVSEGVLDAAEFAHEMVAISDPTYPDCGKSDCENLLEVQRKMQALAAEASEAVGSPKANPFDILKSLRTRQ
jgi:uncharacterized metal-binding protein YceD (DUF177 family)